jgi:LacI family gluconate utilization system Gnt-I transcriptional repressor
MTIDNNIVQSSAITMRDVARLANLSEMTVSRVLTGKGYYSTNAEKKVLAAADSLGYVPNRLAGSLASNRSNLVGVVLPTLSNAVFTEVMSGIYAGLADKGLQPVFGISEYCKEKEEQLVKDMMTWRPAGIIVTGLEHNRKTSAMLRSGDQKVVEIIDVDGDPISSCIGLSHKKAGKIMAEHIIARGYSRLGYIGSNLNLDIRARKRRDEFVRVLEMSGGTLVHELIPEQASSMHLGRALTAEMLALSHDLDAIYYSNDDMAAGGLMHCIAEKISVPNDIALASFNGLSFIDALPLKITTVRSPRFEIGRLASNHIASADSIQSRSENPHSMTIELNLILDAGDTT